MQLEVKADAVRKTEAGKIQSIINPLLADHVRHEAVWFVDELRRVDVQGEPNGASYRRLATRSAARPVTPSTARRPGSRG